jgi:BASS family bile acid:Na+ symporter
MPMNQLDQIVINFNQDQVMLLNICLGFLMFGVALELKPKDFKYVLLNPKGVFTGMFSQLVLLPILTLILVWIVRPEYSLALGMILIASCPGGNVSNYAVHLAGANVGLSVILTMVSTVMCAFTTPLIFRGLSEWIPANIAQSIKFNISFGAMMNTIAQLILIPLILGFLFNHFLPVATEKIKGIVKKLSFAIFIGFVIAAVAGNLENLKKYLDVVFYIVLIHNGLALIMGYYWTKNIMKLPERDAQSVSIETGIQNSGLALILIFNYFDGTGGMALIAAWWSIWHLISALGIAFWWKSKKVKPAPEYL